MEAPVARHAPAGVALALLALFALRHYGYEAFPERMAARAWNVHGALVMLCLVGWGCVSAVTLLRGPWLTLALCIGAWWAAEEAMVIGCNVWWIMRPWGLLAGQSACYPLLQFDLGKVGAVVAAGALWRLLHLARKVNTEEVTGISDDA